MSNNKLTSQANLQQESAEQPVTDNIWHKLNAFTDARVGLGRAGISLPTSPLLAFQLAHAQAIDAVHTTLNGEELAKQLSGQNWSPKCEPLFLHSQASDRTTYLQRPDYGRHLDKESAKRLDAHQAEHPQGEDLVIAVVDGLSSLAVEQNTRPFLDALLPMLKAQPTPWSLAPVCFVQQGRVAIGDDICERLNAKCVLVLIGERPGLSSPDSLGVYLTWGGKVGYTDAYRNCISNIRPAGLNYQEAAYKAFYLLKEARQLKLSGVKLKDRSSDDLLEDTSQSSSNFLTP